MLPTQILLNNFLYDLSQISIPTDNVDPALLHPPETMADCVHSPVHDDHRSDEEPPERTSPSRGMRDCRNRGATTLYAVGPVAAVYPASSVICWGPSPLLAVTYLLVVQVVKSWFYRRHALL